MPARGHVFPTRVGVNREEDPERGGRGRIPHACGGEPRCGGVRWPIGRVFPTRVGVNRWSAQPPFPATVFPTRVGVNRVQAHFAVICERIPHACGGEPQALLSGMPRYAVFPTRVGVNRTSSAASRPERSIPHACGGEPMALVNGAAAGNVFPTRVGVNRSTR